MTRVLVSDPIADKGIEILENAGFEVIYNPNPSNDELQSYSRDISAWIVRSGTKILAEYLKDARNLQIIGRAGVGVDNIDINEATNQGIIVMNMPDGNTISAAEHTIAMMMTLSRNIQLGHVGILAGEWNRSSLIGSELQGKVLGVVGLGRIGTAVAMRAKAFGMKVVFYDPYISNGIEKSLNIGRVHHLTDLLVESDIVTIHTPITDDTKGMVNAEFFNKMKNESSLYNTARGEIIVMDDLYHALKKRKIKWAGLDVLETEPIDYDHPLIRAWCEDEKWISGRLVITPHTAFYNKQSYEEMRKKAAEELKRIIEGNKPLNRVN